MIDLGKVRPGSTIRIPFHTSDKDDASAITMTNFAVADILIYKDGSTTERASTAGFTATTDFDAKTGKHVIVIDLADNTTAGFYAAGSEYLVAIDAVTVDAVVVGAWVARFTIGYKNSLFDTTIATLASQTSFTLTSGPAEDDALNGMWVIIHDVASGVQCGQAVILDYTGVTKTVTLVAGTTFTAAATDNISIMGPSPLQPTTMGRTLTIESDGMAHADVKEWLGTAPLALASQYVQVDAIRAAGTAWNSGAIGAATLASDTITAAKIAADAITAAKIATGAIDADALAADAGTEIGTAVWASGTRTLTSLAGLTVDTVTTLTNLPAITANWLTAAGTAADFGTEIGTAVWATATRTLTAGTNVDGSTFTAIPWNASWDTEVQSEVQDAIEVNHLDHLIAVADPGGVVANSSFLAKLTSKSATPAFSSYDNTTDSLEAVRDRGDSAWITATSVTVSDKTGFSLSATQTFSNTGTWTGNIVGTLSTLTTYTGNTPQTGDSYLHLTSAMADSIPADGTRPSPTQALYMMVQGLFEGSISGTTWTIKKVDGSTTLFTVTLNSATTPTSKTRAT